MHPYLAADRGKFVEVCLNRPLDLNENYEFTMTFRTTERSRQECSGIPSN
jgi:hypothetical protein